MSNAMSARLSKAAAVCTTGSFHQKRSYAMTPTSATFIINPIGKEVNTQ
jgi:hypothetical protein